MSVPKPIRKAAKVSEKPNGPVPGANAATYNRKKAGPGDGKSSYNRKKVGLNPGNVSMNK